MKEEGGGVAADDRIRQLMMATSKDHAANNGSTLGTKVVPGVKPNSCEQLLIKIKQTQQYAKVIQALDKQTVEALESLDVQYKNSLGTEPLKEIAEKIRGILGGVLFTCGSSDPALVNDADQLLAVCNGLFESSGVIPLEKRLLSKAQKYRKKQKVHVEVIQAKAESKFANGFKAEIKDAGKTMSGFAAAEVPVRNKKEPGPFVDGASEVLRKSKEMKEGTAILTMFQHEVKGKPRTPKQSPKKGGQASAKRPSKSMEAKPAGTAKAPAKVQYRFTGETVNLSAEAQRFLALVLMRGFESWGKKFPLSDEDRKRKFEKFERNHSISRLINSHVKELQAMIADIQFMSPGNQLLLEHRTFKFWETLEMLMDHRCEDVFTVVHSIFADDPANLSEISTSQKQNFEAVLGGCVKQLYRVVGMKLPLSIEMNTEPYLNRDWNKDPYTPKPYIRLDKYKPAGGDADKATIDEKLQSKKTGGCDGAYCQSGKLVVESFKAGKILTCHPCLQKHTECDETCKCDPKSCPNRAIKQGSKVDRVRDIEEKDVWGFDCYTRRNIEDAILECGVFEEKDEGTGIVNGVKESTGLARNRVSEKVLDNTKWFVDKILMPEINANTDSAWDLRKSLRNVIAKQNDEKDGKKIATACNAVLDVVNLAGLNYFRVHPKGRGVICKNPNGIPSATFVSQYLGEVYLPYRWFELQDAIKKFNPRQELNDFYNIVLERPKDDPAGYDVLFVDAAHEGAVASRISHSCDPNCEANILSSNGRLSIAIYTARDISCGEELTFDYSCVTESFIEYREAICLCGMSMCRGSFLSLADGKAYQQVIHKNHHFLHRNALILKSGTEEVTEEDLARMRKFGFKSSILGPGVSGTPESDSSNMQSKASTYKLPTWLLKWIALTLQYIEVEEKLLPPSLVRDFPTLYTLENATIEAIGVRDQRVQNLTITVDKVKHILSQPGQSQNPPLRFLSDAEEMEYLWTGETSIVNRIFKTISSPIKQLKALTTTSPGSEIHSLLKSLEQMREESLETPMEARTRLLMICHTLKALDDAMGGRRKFNAMVDLGRMVAFTAKFFAAERYDTLISTDVLQKKHVKYNDHSKSDIRMLESLGNTDIVKEWAKKYGPNHLWGQLVFWFKQTINEPNASLSADRRGTLSLPDIESASGGSKYGSSTRINMIKTLEEAPEKMWKTGTLWSFKNAAKVYGSPWLDAAFKSPFDELSSENYNLKEIFDLDTNL